MPLIARPDLPTPSKTLARITDDVTELHRWAESFHAALMRFLVTLTYVVNGSVSQNIIPGSGGTTFPIDVSAGKYTSINVTNGAAYMIGNPTNAESGQMITIQIANTSGGALGAATWDTNYRLAGAWANPGNNANRSITFALYAPIWYEVSRTAADVPN